MVKDTPISPEAQLEAQAALANGPAIQPWMINAVVESLPHYADRATIEKTLQEFKGNVDFAVSKLLESPSQSSASSRCGSSSVERDHDSDEEDYTGPNKKQDRRLSRAKRSTMTKGDASEKYLSLRLKSPSLPSTSEVHSAVIKDDDEIKEEDWNNSSPYKHSESASISASASEDTNANNTRSRGIRLKLTQPKKHDEVQVVSSPSSPIKSSPSRETRPQDVAPDEGKQTSKPKRRLYSRNQYDMLKKAQQKAAAKERKREIAADRLRSTQSAPLLSLGRKGKENTPAIETHIKVLYI